MPIHLSLYAAAFKHQMAKYSVLMHSTASSLCVPRYVRAIRISHPFDLCPFVSSSSLVVCASMLTDVGGKRWWGSSADKTRANKLRVLWLDVPARGV